MISAHRNDVLVSKERLGPAMDIFWDGVDRYRGPLLILHGKVDRHTPYVRSVVLFEHAASPSKLIRLYEAVDHDLWRHDLIQPTEP